MVLEIAAKSCQLLQQSGKTEACKCNMHLCHKLCAAQKGIQITFNHMCQNTKAGESTSTHAQTSLCVSYIHSHKQGLLTVKNDQS